MYLSASEWFITRWGTKWYHIEITVIFVPETPIWVTAYGIFLGFWSTDSLSNKTFWVTLSFFRKQFYNIFPSMKIIIHGNPDNNLESLCTIKTYIC
jgi:hypothetical protein